MRSLTQVRVGFSWLLPTDWFAATRARFERSGAQVSLVRSDNPATDLRNGVIDIAVARTVGRADGSIRWRPIGTEERVLAVSNRSELAPAASRHTAVDPLSRLATHAGTLSIPSPVPRRRAHRSPNGPPLIHAPT
ncbi:LysR substrate-binding domain-containing protein [Nocardia asteroides]